MYGLPLKVCKAMLGSVHLSQMNCQSKPAAQMNCQSKPAGCTTKRSENCDYSNLLKSISGTFDFVVFKVFGVYLVHLSQDCH